MVPSVIVQKNVACGNTYAGCNIFIPNLRSILTLLFVNTSQTVIEKSTVLVSDYILNYHASTDSTIHKSGTVPLF